MSEVAPAFETTHRAEMELGLPVTAEGEVRWLSGSSVTKADPNSEGGCLRRFWYHYVGSLLGVSIREPETEQMRAGTGMHAEIERYLRTGQLALGQTAMAGLAHIPRPGPGLHVEQPIIEGGSGLITRVHLRLARIPYAGHLDLYNLRDHYLDAEGEQRPMPPDALECRDWKSTADLKWAKNPQQVASAIPMVGYAMAGFAMWPRYERARLTHVYFQRGKRAEARCATSLPDRSHLERRWEYAGRIALRIVDAARETDPNKIDHNPRACRSYNKDCPHLAYCDAGKKARQDQAVEDILGPVDRWRNAQHDGDLLMGLLDKVGKPQANDTGVSVGLSFEDLLAEEDAGRAEVSAPKPLDPITPVPGFFQAWKVVLDSGLGKPALEGAAANMHETGHKRPYLGGKLEGEGKLAQLAPIAEAAQLIELARQIEAKKAAAEAKRAAAEVAAQAAKLEADRAASAQAKQPIAMLPPDAPASRPELAAEPVEGLDTPNSRKLAAMTPSAIEGLVESVQTPTPSTAQPASAGTDLDAVTPSEPTPQPAADPAPLATGPDGKTEAGAPDAKVTEGKPRRGRPPGATTKPKADPKPEPAAPTAVEVARSVTAAIALESPPAAPTAISIYVDVVVDGLALLSLDDYVNAAADACPSDTEVVAACRKVPPPPGAYVVDTRGNPLAERVAVALRPACLKSGGVFVRGAR